MVQALEPHGAPIPHVARGPIRGARQSGICVRVSGFVLLAALALALLPLVIAVRRGAELFVVRVRRGEAHLFRGRIPQSLLDEIGDVVRSPMVAEIELRVVRRAGRPELSSRGEIGQDQLQQLRNVLGRYSVQRIAAGGRRRR
jgi:hypothetical protein